jgi:photosynthetic reaction center cytochrome c subunit
MFTTCIGEAIVEAEVVAPLSKGICLAMSERTPSGCVLRKWIYVVTLAATLLWIPATIVAHPSFGDQAAGQSTDSAKPKTAAEAFKNIQILKDIPADQLLPSMRYMTAALGVRCDYCHDAEHFDTDDKAPKQTARKMMTMMFAINAANFTGRREVTCYTCHRGSSKPVSLPKLPEIAVGASSSSPGTSASQNVKPATSSNSADANSASLPSAEEIFAKYLQAIGGAESVAKNTTRAENGTVEGPRALHATIETYRKAPNKAYAVLHTPNGDVLEGVDGRVGWGRRANGELTDESGDELARSKQWAAFYPGAQFQQDYSRFQVRGIENVDGHDAYLVMAWWPAGGTDALYFDTQTGLLLRITHQIDTPLGSLPLETDYDDYRDVNGLKIPFKVRVSRMDGTTTYTWQKMDANVPVDGARFDKPAQKPSPEKPAK